MGKREEKQDSKLRHNKSNKIIQGMACNMLKHAFLTIRSYLELFVDFLFSLYWDDRSEAVPALSEKHAILKESAVTLAKKIRNKELKSEDLVQACIERIKEVNPVVNAVTDERYEAALEDARAVDRQIAEGLSDDDFEKKPFLGVPFTAKESHAVAGMLHTLGILSRRRARAPADATCVRLLREAGAIPVAVTNVPEINKWQETRNYVFGTTCNPYNSGRTTGGSSGGEAALNAALAVPISLCSDIGGSTRMPAFFCGLFGLNPTPGLTNLEGSALRTGEHATMASIGFVSRHCEDLAPLTAIAAAENAHKMQLDKPVDIKDIKFYYTETARDLRISPIRKDLRKAMDQVITKISIMSASESTGRQPRAYAHPGLSHLYSLWRHGMAKELDSFPKLLANNKGEAIGLVEIVKKFVGLSDFTLAAILRLLDEQVMPPVNKEWGDRMTQELRDDIINTLGDDGVLLFPSSPAVAPYHYALYTRPFNFAYWGVLNALHLPSAQVPLGLNKAGLPLGIQVVAAPHKEKLCLAVAQYLEKEFGGFEPPCRVSR